MITDLPRRHAPLPVASRAIDSALLQQLVADAALLHGWAVALVPVARSLQQRCGHGSWYSRRELSTVQRQCRTLLRASRAHRQLADETLVALDLAHAFCEGLDMIACKQVAA